MDAIPDTATGRLYHALIGAVLRHRTFVLEWFLALEALWCGLFIAMPGNTFTEQTVFHGVPEPLVATLFLSHGALGVWVLIAENTPNRTRSRANLDFCRRSALASAGFWLLILASYLLQPPAFVGLAVPLLFSLSVTALWVYLRLYLRFGP